MLFAKVLGRARCPWRVERILLVLMLTLASSGIPTGYANPQGSEFPVNTTTLSNQTAPAVAMDENGNFVVVWQSSGQDSSGEGIYAQRYNAAGVPQGSEFLVYTQFTNDQTNPAVAMDRDGDFIVVWQSFGQDDIVDSEGVFLHRYNAAGVSQGSDFQVNVTTSNDQMAPAITMDEDGNFVVVWQSEDVDGDQFGIVARVFNAAGGALVGEIPVNTTSAGNQTAPAVAMDKNGNFVITWQSGGQDGGGLGVYARVYNAAFVPQTGELLVNSTTAGDQSAPAIAIDENGNFVVVWQSAGQDGGGLGVYGRRFNAAGTPLAGEFPVNTTTANDQSAPSIAMDQTGQFVVAWQSTNQDGSGLGVYAQAFNAAGVAQSTEFRVNSTVANDQSAPAAAMDWNGDYVIAWQSDGQDGSGLGVYAQRHDFLFPTVPTATNLTQVKPYTEDDPSVALDDIVVTDPDLGETITATLTLAAPVAGSLTTSGTASYTPGTGVWTISGTVAQVNAALAAVAFVPAPNNDQNASISTLIRDVANTGPAAGTITLNVAAVNDPPVNTVPGVQTTPANTPLVLSTTNGNAVSFTDADAGAATNLQVTLSVPANLQVTLSVPAGVGSLSPGLAGTVPPLTSVSGSGTNVLQLAGSVTALNSALQGLTFTPQAGVTGLTALTVATSDAGNTGGPAQQDVDIIPINVGSLPVLSINDPAAVTEGDSGASNSVVFTVTLSAASNLTVTVPYTTADQTAAGGATCAGSTDYQTTAGTLTFAPSETSKTVTVPICGDTAVESNETFRVDLGTPVNAALLDGQGIGTIQNDDLAGTISFTAATASVQENGGTVALTVQRTVGTAPGVTVQYGTSDVTAQAGADYTATTGTLTFGAGETSKTITVPVLSDPNSEPSETFTVTLANPQGGAALGTPSVATVAIVDTTPGSSGLQGQDDTDPTRKNTKESKDVKETDEERQQREHTNRGNRDDIATEGNITEVHLDADPPYLVIGNRDGAVIVRLMCGDQCPVIRLGDYIEVDGEKQHEQLYDAEQVTVTRPR